jgi:PhnB protein
MKGNIPMQVQPYLCFNGRCDEAIELYKKVFKTDAHFVMRVSDAPEGACGGAPLPANWGDKVMHSEMKIGESTVMFTDGMSDEPAKFDGISLTVLAADAAEADRLFAGLGEGGQVQMPLGETFFSPRFGIVADKFGVSWMVIVPKPM